MGGSTGSERDRETELQQLDLAEDSSVRGLPAAPSSRGEAAGGGGFPETISAMPPPGPKHTCSGFHQAPVGPNPSSHPVLLGANLSGGAQAAEAPITQGLPPGQPRARSSSRDRLGVLSWLFQLPGAGAACALEPRSRPHHFFILIFFSQGGSN